MNNRSYLVKVTKKVGDKDVIVDVAHARNYVVARNVFMRAYRGEEYTFLVIDKASEKVMERIEGHDNPYNTSLPPQERR